MNQLKFDKILKKYQEGRLSKSQKKTMDEWFDSFPQSPDNWSESELKELKSRTLGSLANDFESRKKKKRLYYPTWAIRAAAVVFLGLSIGLIIHFASKMGEPQEISQVIFPGGNKALLRMDDGTSLELDESQSGIRILPNAAIEYYDGSLVELEQKKEGRMATLVVPRGGQYQVTLSDGSVVYLNSESKLEYPIEFSNDSRLVKLEGEGYFSVEPKFHQKNGQTLRTPFLVEMKDQQIQVLGTKFNANDYSAEKASVTTLVEGSVRIHFPKEKGQEETLQLQPGEQSSLLNGKVEVRTVDVNDALAWIKGDFVFSDETIENVMLKLARWYDVEVVYEGAIPEARIWATMSRANQIEETLSIIELTSLVRFKVKGRRVYVSTL